MPLKKILFRPGVNRENTRYASESIGAVNQGTQAVGGWYESEKVRFRAGTPEKIGGWTPVTVSTYLGVCRSLWKWVTLDGRSLTGVGTNLKFYLEYGGAYYDITPLRSTATLTNPFTTSSGLTSVNVYDVSHGAALGDYVTFSGATAVGGLTLNGNYEIKAIVNNDNYTIQAASQASFSATGGGTVTAKYEIPIGQPSAVPVFGWGAGGWGTGTWGIGTSSSSEIRLWSQSNFGEDLVFAYRGGSIYYWDATGGITDRGVLLNSNGGNVTFTVASPTVVTLPFPYVNGTSLKFDVSAGGTLPTGISNSTTYYVQNLDGLQCNISTDPGGASLVVVSGAGSGTFYISDLLDVPTIQNFIFISDVSSFLFAFGCNDLTSATQDPMLIRWSDQEAPTAWYPSSTNQAGSVRLSHGSTIVSAIQTRQEIVVFTDSSVYSLQYVGSPIVWSSQLLGDNISIVGQNSVSVASGVVYWMGTDKFYKYDGRVQTLRCDLRQYIYGDINLQQADQIYSGTNEGFNEVWWFYCSAENNTNTPDKYVIYNYLEDIWYYGTMARTAWIDSGISEYPVGAVYTEDVSPYGGRLVYHENGVDDNVNGIPQGMVTSIASSEFDIDDGHNFGFVYRILPDLTFRGSVGSIAPQVTMTLIPLANSGSGYNDPQSEGGSSYATIQRITQVPVEQFTGQVFVRVRGRQMVFRLDSTQLGTQWQLGAPRIDIKTDGRRGNS